MNQVTVTVNDKRKELRFSEALTTGSTYEVTVTGGATTAGAAGSLVILENGKLLAYAQLTNGTGTLSTNTKELGEVFKDTPTGMAIGFEVVLHKNGTSDAENIATGAVDIISAGGAWTNDTTGALALYKGDKGDNGVGIVRIEDKGLDSDGNRLVNFVLTNGSGVQFTIPKGSQGICVSNGYALYSSEAGGDDKWHAVYIAKNAHNEMTLAIGEAGYDTPPEGGILEGCVYVTGTQTITGQKTFTSAIVASGGVTGNLTGKADTAGKLHSAIQIVVKDDDESHQAASVSFDGSGNIVLKLPATVKATIEGNTTGDHTGAVNVQAGKTLSVYGSETHGGNGTHSGTETHGGIETHGGSVSIAGELNATNVKDPVVGITIADQAVTKAMSEKSVWDLVALVAPYLNSNWVYVQDATLHEGYNGSIEGAVLENQVKWRNPGLASIPTADQVASGLFGFRTTSIEKYACYSPDYLRQISFPNVTTVGKYAFKNANELERIHLPLCEQIGEYAFASSAGLRSLDLPKAVKIGAFAFNACSTSATDETVEIKIGAQATLGTEGNYNEIGEKAFYGISTNKITKIDLPTMQKIGANAFTDQRKVKTLNLPEVIEIGDYAFYFLNYSNAAAATDYQLDLNLPKCVTIGFAAFGTNDARYQTYGVKSLNAPLLTTIAEAAFYYERGLRTVNCPELTSIGNNAFIYCDNLNTFTAPKVTTIGNNAFNACTSIRSFNFPNLTTIGTNAFSGATALTDLYITEKSREEIRNMSGWPWGRSVALFRMHGSNGWVDGTGAYGEEE